MLLFRGIPEYQRQIKNQVEAGEWEKESRVKGPIFEV